MRFKLICLLILTDLVRADDLDDGIFDAAIYDQRPILALARCPEHSLVRDSEQDVATRQLNGVNQFAINFQYASERARDRFLRALHNAHQRPASISRHSEVRVSSFMASAYDNYDEQALKHGIIATMILAAPILRERWEEIKPSIVLHLSRPDKVKIQFAGGTTSCTNQVLVSWNSKRAQVQFSELYNDLDAILSLQLRANKYKRLADYVLAKTIDKVQGIRGVVGGRFDEELAEEFIAHIMSTCSSGSITSFWGSACDIRGFASRFLGDLIESKSSKEYKVMQEAEEELSELIRKYSYRSIEPYEERYVQVKRFLSPEMQTKMEESLILARKGITAYYIKYWDRLLGFPLSRRVIFPATMRTASPGMSHEEEQALEEYNRKFEIANRCISPEMRPDDIRVIEECRCIIEAENRIMVMEHFMTHQDFDKFDEDLKIALTSVIFDSYFSSRMSDDGSSHRKIYYFYGPPSTGKTYAAERLVKFMGLPYHTACLASVGDFSNAKSTGTPYGNLSASFGWLFSPFIANLDDPERSATNCFLILNDCDRFFVDSENFRHCMTLLLRLLDPETTTVHSDYFGADIDVSRLNIIITGNRGIPRTEDFKALYSRLRLIKFDGFSGPNRESIMSDEYDSLLSKGYPVVNKDYILADLLKWTDCDIRELKVALKELLSNYSVSSVYFEKALSYFQQYDDSNPVLTLHTIVGQLRNSSRLYNIYADVMLLKIYSGTAVVLHDRSYNFPQEVVYGCCDEARDEHRSQPTEHVVKAEIDRIVKKVITKLYSTNFLIDEQASEHLLDLVTEEKRLLPQRQLSIADIDNCPFNCTLIINRAFVEELTKFIRDYAGLSSDKKLKRFIARNYLNEAVRVICKRNLSINDRFRTMILTEVSNRDDCIPALIGVFKGLQTPTLTLRGEENEEML